MGCDDESCGRVCNKISFSSLKQRQKRVDNVLQLILLKRESAVERKRRADEFLLCLFPIACVFIYSKLNKITGLQVIHL